MRNHSAIAALGRMKRLPTECAESLRVAVHFASIFRSNRCLLPAPQPIDKCSHFDCLPFHCALPLSSRCPPEFRHRCTLAWPRKSFSRSYREPQLATIIILQSRANIRFVSYPTDCCGSTHFGLAFRAWPSDESSCAKQGAEKDTDTNMTNEENNKAATVAELGAHGAPQKAASKKGATRRKDAPKRQKKSPSWQENRQASPCQRSHHGSRRN